MADVAASVLAKLRNKAKASGISYQQCLQLFVQEEFLRKINSVLFFLPALICILRNSLQGMGDTKTPLISSLIELVGKTVIAYTLVSCMEYLGVIIAEPIVWSVMVIPLIV